MSIEIAIESLYLYQVEESCSIERHFSVTMAQLNPDTTSALAPPEGVRADFENPYCQAGAVYAAQSILLGVASLILAARIYTKALLMKQLGCDDCENDGSPD